MLAFILKGDEISSGGTYLVGWLGGVIGLGYERAFSVFHKRNYA